MRPGGIGWLEAEIRRRFADRICTRTMREIGCQPGRIYNAEEVTRVRDEIPVSPEVFLLNSDWRDRVMIFGRCDVGNASDSYPASAFSDVCREMAAELLGTWLTDACLHDEPLKAPGWMPDLLECLEAMSRQSTGSDPDPIVPTAVTRAVNSSLDYSQRQGCLTLVWGKARIGKTYSARAWVARSGGLARFVEVPSSSDVLTLLRAVAAALGIRGCERQQQSQLRAQIMETLQSGDLMLVLDEAHRLWPQAGAYRCHPRRVEWLMEIVNTGTPVALLGLGDFFSRMAVVTESGWSSEQFLGRLKHSQELPPLCQEDLAAVAEALLPSVNQVGHRIISNYALVSGRCLGGVEAMVLRARFIASERGRLEVTAADVKAAYQDGMVPSDSALAAALSPQGRRTGSRRKPIGGRSVSASTDPARSAPRADSVQANDGPESPEEGRVGLEDPATSKSSTRITTGFQPLQPSRRGIAPAPQHGCGLVLAAQ